MARPSRRRLLFSLALLALSACLPARGWAAGEVPDAAPSSDHPEAAPLRAASDLVIGNRFVFTFRASNQGIPPEDRAAGALVRVQDLIEKESPGAVTLLPIPEGYLVKISGAAAFRILAQDVDPEGDETVDSLARATQARLEQVLAEERELRDPPRLLRAAAWAALLTLTFVLLVVLIGHGAARLSRWLDRITKRGVERLQPGGFGRLGAETAEAIVRFLVRTLQWSAWLVATYAWLTSVLHLFPRARPWGEELGLYLWAATSTILLAVAQAIPGLAVIGLIVVVTRWLIRLGDALFRAVQDGTVSARWLHPDTAEATRRILNVTLWLFALALAYPFMPGSGSNAFKGVSLFAGLMISLGSATLVGQVLSGFIIIYARSFKPGDYVLIGETEGVVRSIGLFATKVETVKREMVSIPNTVVMGGQTKNYSRLARSEGVILHTSVTIGYGAPWRQVHAMLIAAADRTPGLRKDPPPFVLQTSLSDFYVEYQINAHLDAPELRIPTLAALHANIQDSFNEHGVQILSPHYLQDPAEPAVVPREKWFTPPARPD